LLGIRFRPMRINL